MKNVGSTWYMLLYKSIDSYNNGTFISQKEIGSNNTVSDGVGI